MQPSTRDGHREQELESEDGNGDLRRPGTVTANAAVDTIRVPGAKVRDGGMRGIISMGSSVIVVGIDVPLPMVAS